MTVDITPIPALKDNYIWMLSCAETKSAVVVDPGEAKPVIETLRRHDFHLVGILVTHHHWDHTNGIAELVERYQCPVYGPGLKTGKIYLEKLNTEFSVLEIPGHTLDQIAFVGLNSVFPGDTLFCAGCGRVFEGTYEQMYESLQKLINLPENTKVYCGHEYTQNNLKFARVVEPHNPNFDLQTLVPSNIKIEKLTNPFLRCHLPDVHKAAENYCGKRLSSSVDVFQALRKWKDNY